MCINGEQAGNLNNRALFVAAWLAIGSLLCGFTQAPGAYADPATAAIGGVVEGENLGGMADSLHVVAPPNWQLVMEIAPGTFLDCGKGMQLLQADDDGRTKVPLSCGVTLTETLVIPSASKPAELIIHY